MLTNGVMSSRVAMDIITLEVLVSLLIPSSGPPQSPCTYGRTSRSNGPEGSRWLSEFAGLARGLKVAPNVIEES